MGILDEAIREHLALKRRQGLSDDELKRLEDEAFGPPARPGEPDFPDREAEGEEGTGPDSEVADAAEKASGDPALEEAAGQPSREGAAREPIESGADPATVEQGERVEAPSEGTGTAPRGEEPAIDSEAPTTFYDQATDAGQEPAPVAHEPEELGREAEEVESKPEAAEEEPAEPVDEAAEPHPTAEEEAAAEPYPTEEEEPSEELVIGELDLELDDELADVRKLDRPDEGREPEAAEEPTPAPPIESLETVEHRIDEEPPSEEHGVEEPPSEEHAAGEPATDEQVIEEPSDEYEVEEPESDEYAAPEPESDEYRFAEPTSDEHELEEDEGADDGSPGESEAGEDVLEETPDFLRDAPEDDELWFEQGEPKDFDF